MESEGSDEKEVATQIAIKYCNLIDNSRGDLALYLSEDVILDWFGRTIAGKEQVVNFMRQEVPTVHKLLSIEPSSPVQLRRRPVTRRQKREDSIDELAHLINFTGGLEKTDTSTDSNSLEILNKQKLPFYRTGKKHPKTAQNAIPITSRNITPVIGRVEMGQGDSMPDQPTFFSTKRFLEARGCIQFTRSSQSPTSSLNLKLAADTKKWERNIKLHIGYTYNKTVNDFEISLLIYSSNSSCRKNLNSAFSKMTEEC